MGEFIIKMTHPIYGSIYAQPDGPPSPVVSTALVLNEEDAKKIKVFWSDFWKARDPEIQVSIEKR